MRNIIFKIFCFLTVLILFISPLSVLAEEDASEVSSLPEPSAALSSAPMLGATITYDFNQYLPNGNFTNKNNWSVNSGSSWSVSDNVAFINPGSSQNGIYYYLSDILVQDHLYLFVADLKGNFCYLQNNISGSNVFSYSSSSSEFNTVFSIVRCNSTSGNIKFSSRGESFYVKNAMVIDLTQCFGSGREPSTLEQFKTVFPDNYYSYTTGTRVVVETENYSFSDKLTIVIIVELAVIIFYFLFGRAWKA